MAQFELPPDPFDEIGEAAALLTQQVEQLNQMLTMQGQLLQQIVAQGQALQQELARSLGQVGVVMQRGFAELREIAAAPAVPEFGPDGRIVSAHKVIPGRMMN